MEMKKQKKIIGGMILVLAVTACASFFKSAAEEIAQEETSEIYQNEIKTIYTEAYQDEVETQIEEEKSSGAYTEDNMLIKYLVFIRLFYYAGAGICFLQCFSSGFVYR